MRRRRRRNNRSRPPPPLSAVLQSKIPIPYDVSSIALLTTYCGATACKGRSNHLGELAELVLGERPKDDTARLRGVAASTRERARSLLVPRGT
jgi:hypothetical protein